MKVKPCPKGKPVIIAPVGMSGSELKQIKIFDIDTYESLTLKQRQIKDTADAARRYYDFRRYRRGL